MAFTSEYVEITLRYEYLGQKMQTARTFRAEGIILLTIDAHDLGEAFWNDVLGEWRALAPASVVSIFESVLVAEVGGSLNYGEFPIPLAQSTGLRDVSTLGNPLPSFVNVGCRLSVPTRDTRPGQMRIPFLYEGDSSGQQWGGVAIPLVEAVAGLYSTPRILGAPAATVTLHPQVWGTWNENVPPLVAQDINGFVLNPNLSSQVSRKVGRGR